MALILRPYQAALVAAVRPGQCVVLPTGGGKTAILAGIAQGAQARGQRVAVVVPWRVLVEQTAERFKAWGIDCPIVCAETAVRRDVSADLLLLDEAHRYAGARRRGWIGSGAVIGVSATPWRHDGDQLRGLGRLFPGGLVVGPSVRELIEAGALVPPAFRTAGRIEADAATPGAGVVFCARADEARAAAHVISATRPAAALLSTSTTAERRAALDLLERGGVVCTVAVIGEGFDAPGLAWVRLARSMNLRRYLQAVGRVMRPAHGKTAGIVIDPGRLVVKYGYPFQHPAFPTGSDLRACRGCGWVHPGSGALVCVSSAAARALTARPLALDRVFRWW